MADVVVLCPTRNRPAQAAAMVQSLRDTAHLFATQVVLVVDADDPELEGYLALPVRFTEAGRDMPLRPADRPVVMVLEAAETGDLTTATNTAARRIWDDDCIIGHVGDDHRFRTPGWDRRVVETLRDPGVASGDDGVFGESIPTAWFCTSSIPRALGWLALPVSHHYGIDNAWRDIGLALGGWHYLPDVRIEQPSLRERKRTADAVLQRALSRKKEDAAAYYRWRDEGGLAADIERIKPMVLGAVPA